MPCSYTGLTALGAAMAMLCAGQALAQTAAISQNASVSGYAANGPMDANGNQTGLTAQHFLVSSGLSPVSITIAPSALPAPVIGTNPFFSQSSHFGAASAEHQTLRAMADLNANAFGGADAKTFASFTKDVTVLGQPGQQAGDATTLALTLRMNGDAKAGLGINAPPGSILQVPSGRILSTVDSSLNYRVFDLDQETCAGSECNFLQLANLAYSGKLMYDYAFQDGLIRYHWNGFNFTGGTEQYFSGADVDDQFQNLDPGYLPYTVDSGSLLLSIDTFVGHTLRVSAGLDVFVQAWTGGAVGDFSHTFDAGLSGIGESPGVYALAAVPEPGTYAMMGAGLCVLGYMARRRRMRAAV